MRAGPLSDEAFIRLLNRRFVSFHFDLFPHGYLSDPDAKQWVKKHLPEFSGSAVATPPIVFLKPNGEVVGKVSNYATTETAISKTLEILKANPEFNRLTAPEQALTGIEKARMLIDLQQYDQASQELSSLQTTEARYLMGHLARLDNDSKAMESHFSLITDQQWLDDVRMERAYQYWDSKDYEALANALANFPSNSNRFSEAQYFEGLAYHHQGNFKKAKSIWKKLIRNSEEDRWIYRADWAYTQSGKKSKPKGFIMSTGSNSLLGRIGYMGATHPDLRDQD